MASCTHFPKNSHRQLPATKIQNKSKSKSKLKIPCLAEEANRPCTDFVDMEGVPWLCSEHADKYQQSYEGYKAASESSEAIRDCVVLWEDQSNVADLRTLEDVQDAIELTQTYIAHAEKELQGREYHTRVFYAKGAYVRHLDERHTLNIRVISIARPDPGHLKRVDHVGHCITSAYMILDRLCQRRADLTPPEPRLRQKRRRGKKQNARNSPSEVVELTSLSCGAISFVIGEDEEDEESPLARGMDEEEILADWRTERDAEAMLRWYASRAGREVEDEEDEDEDDDDEDEDEEEATDTEEEDRVTDEENGVESLVDYLVSLQGRTPYVPRTG